MVVFATPGMLHAGLSLQIFKKWASDENNTVSIHKSTHCLSHSIAAILKSPVDRLLPHEHFISARNGHFMRFPLQKQAHDFIGTLIEFDVEQFFYGCAVVFRSCLTCRKHRASKRRCCVTVAS